MTRAWTLEDVREANAMTAEQWADAHDHQLTVGRRYGAVAAEPWPVIIYVQRLCWTYGEAGAFERLNAKPTARAA